MEKYMKDLVKAVTAFEEQTNTFLDKSSKKNFPRKNDARTNITRALNYANNAKNILKEIGK